jgi:hypothetical protein
MQGYAIGRQNGWLSANDIRELEDLNPIEGGEVYLVNGNMVAAENKVAPLTAQDAPKSAKDGGTNKEPTDETPQATGQPKKKIKKKEDDQNE